MAKEEKKAPKLRFNGYTNDWERKKLGILITRVKSYPLSRSVEVKKETDVKYVHYGDIHTNIADEIDKNNNLPFINEIYKEYDELKLDDVIVADASEDYKGIADAAVIISNLPYTIIAGLHTIALRPTSLIKGYFLYHIFKTENFKRFGYKIGTGLKVFGISYNNLAKYKVYYPQEIEEQEKIIGILSNLTNSINLHERKCEELTLIKKALLQKLFPKKDVIKPEVRYKNFSDAWEQRKLGEILKERKERSSIGELISVTINNGVVKADSLERKDNSSSDKSNYKVVCKGDIAYNSMRMWQGASGYSPYNGILSPAYTVLIPTEKVDSKFISYMFKKEKMLQQFQKYSQGLTSDTWNLKYPMLKDIPVLFPKIDEQISIRKHLDNISSLIALHQRKLEKLKQLKKFLLQNMFI